jgi:hypothetical protein
MPRDETKLHDPAGSVRHRPRRDRLVLSRRGAGSTGLRQPGLEFDPRIHLDLQVRTRRAKTGTRSEREGVTYTTSMPGWANSWSASASPQRHEQATHARLVRGARPPRRRRRSRTARGWWQLARWPAVATER